MKILLAGNTNTIAATSTAQTRALPACVPDPEVAVFYNAGPSDVFVCLGGSTLVATLPVVDTKVGAAGNATPIPVGGSLPFRCVTQGVSGETGLTHWAAICKAGETATAYCTTGEGL